MTIERAWAMPNKHTFSIKPIKELLERYVQGGVWLDPFANDSKVASITNDLNSKFDTTYHLTALEFLDLFEENSVDGILFDPPYSPHQVKECYESIGLSVTQKETRTTFWSDARDKIAKILKPCGLAICFGWWSNGIGKTRGFTMEHILLVAHGGIHNDTIVTVERKN